MIEPFQKNHSHQIMVIYHGNSSMTTKAGDPPNAKEAHSMPGHRTAPGVEVPFQPSNTQWFSFRGPQKLEALQKKSSQWIQPTENVKSHFLQIPDVLIFSFRYIKFWVFGQARLEPSRHAIRLQAWPRTHGQGDTKLQCRSVSAATAMAKTAGPMRGTGTHGTDFRGI